MTRAGIVVSVAAALWTTGALAEDAQSLAGRSFGIWWSNAGEAEASVKKCFADMDAEPALAVVNAKFARAKPSAAQLSDPHFASDTEADALRLRIEKTARCRELRLMMLEVFYPLKRPAYRILYYQADQVFDYLINQRINYGVANTLARDAMNAFALRDHAYMAAAGEDERRALSTAWAEELQRAHSNPPQTRAKSCKWVDVNVECAWESP